MHSARPLRPLPWVGSSKRDYGTFPAQVQDSAWVRIVPGADRTASALGKTFEGFRKRNRGARWGFRRRHLSSGLHGVRFREAVYVLHAFKKKSKRGIKTPQTDISIDQAAIARCRARSCIAFYGAEAMKRKIKVEAGSGNIFADLGLPDAETHFLKAQIVAEIYRLTNQRKLTQVRRRRADGNQPAGSVPDVQREFSRILSRPSDGLPDSIRP